MGRILQYLSWGSDRFLPSLELFPSLERPWRLPQPSRTLQVPPALMTSGSQTTVAALDPCGVWEAPIVLLCTWGPLPASGHCPASHPCSLAPSQLLQQHVPDYLLSLNAAEKCCFSWILSKEGEKKIKLIPLLDCVCSVVWSSLLLLKAFLTLVGIWSKWPLVFGALVQSHTELALAQVLNICASIYPYILLSSSLSHSSAIWSVLGFPYTSFIELISFPWGCVLPLLGFLFFHPVISLSLLPRSPSLHTATLPPVPSITYMYLNGMISTNVRSLAH